MSPIQILPGLALLLFGRKLFWLLAGAVGFALGFNLVNRFLPAQPEWLLVLIAAAAGLAGALVAVYLQNAAVGLVAFLAGGAFLANLLQKIGIDLGPFAWFAFAAGGVGAGFLVLFLLEWALILLSAFTGASLIIQPFDLDPIPAVVLFFVLFLTGFGVQLEMLRREERRQARKEA